MVQNKRKKNMNVWIIRNCMKKSLDNMNNRTVFMIQEIQVLKNLFINYKIFFFF